MIHWFKRHPKHLAAESNALSTDMNYKEVCQVRNNLFISHGHIVVRLDKIYRYPILIVYPEATPYELPLIYPLKQKLTQEQVEAFAQGTLIELQQSIGAFVEFYYHLRHQNQSGSLCILEWDNLDDGSKFYGSKTILKRVRDWCAGLTTGIFPPDSQEVEFCSHFNYVDYSYKLFYPDSFLNESFVEGEAFATLFHHRFDRKTFFGCLMIGKTNSGLYESADFTLPIFLFEEGITSAFQLASKKDLLKRLVDEGKLLRAPWFQIGREPLPFKELNELLSIIGEGDAEAGLARIMPFYFDELKFKPDHFFVAIRFPKRKGIQELQFFKINKGEKETGGLIGFSDKEAFQHLIASYQIVSAIPGEKFTEESFHQRNLGRADRSVLKTVVVNVVGVGALGSEIADSLGKAGVGTLCLFDNQEVKGPNPVRHLAGLDYMGVPKVLAVREIVSNHNPFINIHINPQNINALDLNDFFSDGSIAISSMADDNTEGYLNERAVIADKTVYYVRALRGGKAARIFRVIPGKDACFNCLNLYRNEGSEFIDVPADKDLPTLKNECNNPVRPASAADLKLIASFASRILLDELQNDAGDHNHWVWSTEALPDLDAYQLKKQVLSPHPHCYYCNHEKHILVYLPKAVEQFTQNLIAADPGIETGGVLAGRIDDEGNFVITHASEPGPNAICTATKFEKDVAFCQTFLDDLYQHSNNTIVYLGEWHSHPCYSR